MLDALQNTLFIPSYLFRLTENYLRSRLFIYDTKDVAETSSILGPDLWNEACDSLLRSKMPEETVLEGEGR